MTEQFEQDAAAVERLTQLTTDSIRRLLEQQDQDGANGAVSLLSVSERDELIEEVGRILPAGNVLSFVMNGIMSVQDRHIDDGAVGRSHLNALMKGLSVMKDNVVYQLAFTGPATVLAGYNMLLELSGHSLDEFLPDGAWQFYVEFGLREDAARHQTETTAFQTLMQQQPTDDVDQLTAWVLASMELIQNYDRLLELIWEENARLEAVESLTGLTGLIREWQRIRPFAAPDPNTSLVAYRADMFERFYKSKMSQVSQEQWRNFSQAWLTPEKLEAIGRRKRAYVRQMQLNRYLEPGEYSDARQPIDPRRVKIAIIYKDNYYLLDASKTYSLSSLESLRQQIRAILGSTAQPMSGIDAVLSTVPRVAQLKLRSSLDRDQREELEQLRKAPIIINWDIAKRDQPLSYIRTNRRGIGDHALTIFRTENSTVFDFSHIFFDGPWAMGVAEILTNESMKYTRIISETTQATRKTVDMKPLNLKPTAKFYHAAERINQPITYISAEVAENIAALQQARSTIKARTGIRVTINDLLVLYRTLFNQYYVPSPNLTKHLQQLKKNQRGATLHRQVDGMFTRLKRSNPSLLIPIDASRYDPKERLFPSTFRNPIPDYRAEHERLVKLQQQAVQRHLLGGKRDAVAEFYTAREDYLAYLRAFSELMQKYREIALSGESMGATAIRLIAGLPEAMKKIADEIPGQFSIVNEAIKGEEVFSNVGRVVPGSSITRFASAKDDNDKKILVWGVMTNDADQLYITLRDFRPPVLELAKAGHADIAYLITHDFLNAYIRGLYTFAEQLQVIIATSKRRR